VDDVTIVGGRKTALFGDSRGQRFHLVPDFGEGLVREALQFFGRVIDAVILQITFVNGGG
jgi:hypothetical protein